MRTEQTNAMSPIKQKISHNFGISASSYDEHAGVERQIADRLIASLKPWKAIIPDGPIMELGSGTGFVTEGLVPIYPHRSIEITDLSRQMVDYCRQKFSDNENLLFAQLDAEEPPCEESYALTVSGLAAHWFDNPALTLGKWLEATKSGGLLLASFYGNESFPQWKKHCQELGLPYTGNRLPDVEEMVVKMSVGPSQVDYYEDTITEQFDSALDFFSHLKRLGASTQKEGQRLSAHELTMLTDYWDAQTDGSIKVDYHVIFLAVKKDY